MSSSPSGNGADAGAAIPNAQHKLIAALGDGMAEAAAGGKTFAAQGDLPKLPLPKLEDTARRYLASLQALQVSAGTAAASDEERGSLTCSPLSLRRHTQRRSRSSRTSSRCVPGCHAPQRQADTELLQNEGPELHAALEKYAGTRASYIEEVSRIRLVAA
jgi:carnitine O-acetyltransferase